MSPRKKKSKKSNNKKRNNFKKIFVREVKKKNISTLQ